MIIINGSFLDAKLAQSALERNAVGFVDTEDGMDETELHHTVWFAAYGNVSVRGNRALARARSVTLRMENRCPRAQSRFLASTCAARAVLPSLCSQQPFRVRLLQQIASAPVAALVALLPPHTIVPAGARRPT